MLGILLAVGAFWYDDPHYWLGTYSLPCSVTELTFVFLHSKIADEPRWSPQTVGSQYQIKTWLAQSSISIVFDIFLICLPIPLVATMQAPPRQKLVILGLFAIGSA
jgi:hypothetical protein